MKALILASGVGSRMKDSLSSLPKPLILVGGRTILDCMLSALRENGVHDIVITTGFEADKVRSATKGDLTFVHNPRFAETNYIYSMWLARSELEGDDVLLCHGDLLFDPSLLSRVIKHEGSCALLQKGRKLPQKDFKARVQEGRILAIGVNVFGDDAFPCMPMYKLLSQDFAAWMERIDAYMKKGNVLCYAEDALNEILPKLNVAPAWYDAEFCMEVDTADDLALAETLIS